MLRHTVWYEYRYDNSGAHDPSSDGDESVVWNRFLDMELVWRLREEERVDASSTREDHERKTQHY